MTPFVIAADLRTGSTLLSTSLQHHPEIRCYGELFHTEDFPDNQLEQYDRHHLDAREVIQKAFAPEGYKAIGFRSMVFLPFPSRPGWADVWERLSEMENLHVIYLTRKDHLAQYASLLVAQETGIFHPPPDDPILKPENRPTITITPEELTWWIEEREKLYTRRREQLRGKPSFELEYECLIADWTEVMHEVQEFLGVTPTALEKMKDKQERRPLSAIITNFDELVQSEFSRTRPL